MIMTPKDILNGKNLDIKKQICCYYKLSWGNALANSIGKGPFTAPSKAQVNTLLTSVHPFFEKEKTALMLHGNAGKY